MTEKQERWQKRNRILWRLKGMSIPTYESSRELGFNAIERYKICGKPMYKNGLCKKKKCYSINY